MKMLIKNGTVITMDSNKDKYIVTDILIEDDTIIKIDNNISDEVDKVIDANKKIVLPGLINCHTHLGMSIFRATNDNLNLYDWLSKKIEPIEDNMTDDDMYYTSLLSCIEMIKTGTTCSSDMYFGVNGTLKALRETKVRELFSRCIVGNDEATCDVRVNEFEELYDKIKDDKLIKASITPHALYSCNSDTLIKSEKLATKYNLPIHIHLSENKSEVDGVITKYGKKPVEVLNDVGFLNHKLILAHGTFISDSEIEVLKNKDVSIAHNPVSNLNLGCGIADIVKYMKNGINICLGTDGAGSGNNLNMFYHMSIVDLLQKGIYQNPEVISSYDVLKMATINGAKALGMDDLVGSIEVGKKADIIILDLNKIETSPTPDIITQVVHNVLPENVDTTIINGEILMENNKLLLDIIENELIEKLNSIINR